MSMRRGLAAKALVGTGLVVAAIMSPGLIGAASPPSTARGGDFQFKSMLDNSFCLDVDDTSGHPQAILSQCTPVVSERFTLSDGADGQNLLIDTRGRCLSRGPKLSKEFFAVDIAPCTYGAKEKWSFLVTGEVTHLNTNRCLVIPRAAANVAVNLVPCDATNSQRWKLSQ